ncbi:MAG: glycosyltransferase family 2 protein [Raoultibacter sp.]|jgi:glycosyltransferase involved in cell wall biosynthesis
MGQGYYDPKISVIVPMFKCEDYIEECLRSLQQQSLPDFEAICVDDGSPDNSLARAKACVADDDRFSFIEFEQNKGLSAARNAAMRQARGEYLVFLDSDDYFVPDALEKIYTRASVQNLDDLYFSAQSFYDSYEAHQLVQEDYSKRLPFNDVANGKELFVFFQHAHQFFPQAAFHAVKRSFIEETGINFYEGILHEDVLFSYRVITASERSSFLNEPLYMRRIREGSIMTEPKRTLKNVNGLFISMMEMKAWLYAHAEELDIEFVQAITGSMTEFFLIIAHDWFTDISEEDRASYLAGLEPQQRIVFFEDVVARGSAVAAVKEEYLESITYRVGDTILKAPRVVKDQIGSALRYRKDKA